MNTTDLITVTTDPADADRTRLVLRGRLTVACAGELHRAALALVARAGHVTIDCSAVEYADVAAVQVLLCLERELAGRGRRGALAGVPAALAADFRLMGLGGAPSPPPAPSSKWHDAIRAVAGFPSSAAD
ncbi:MAG: STAS domain-containing protein [Planctomycetes bacterium]|nr:STAS domain-containing protein [Planctomycetota bacterium]